MANSRAPKGLWVGRMLKGIMYPMDGNRVR